MIETVTAALARQARQRPSAVALTDGRVQLTWSEVQAWVERAAGWLLATGLARGSPVLGWLPNCLEWYLVRLACEQAGFFWVPVPASQGRRELLSIAERVRPAVIVTKAVFREHDYRADMDDVCAQLGIEPLRITLPDEGLLRLDGAAADAAEALRLDEQAHALATSGSQGMPKLAIYTLGAACARAHAQAALLELTPADTLLVLSPGTGPARAAWLAATVAGACVLAMPQFGSDAALDLIESARPTIVCGTPAQLAILAPKLERIDSSSVRMWYTAGSVIPVTLAEDLEARTRGIVYSNYGGSDFGGWAAPSPRDPPAVRHRTVGKPRGGTVLRIVNTQGYDLPQGGVGELIGRGPCCVCGFLGESGRQQWRDGWFHTGDLAFFDEQGNIVIVGRLKEVIVRGGDKVSPAEVEGLLRTHPQVGQVAVIGIPDRVLGERVCACVVPAPPGSTPDLDGLRQHLRRQGMAAYKAPEHLMILDSLPMVSDKVDRRALAALARQPAASQT